MSVFDWLKTKPAKEKEEKEKSYEFDDKDRALSVQIRRDKAEMRRMEHELEMQEMKLRLQERRLQIREREKELEDDEDEDDFFDEEGGEDAQLMKLLSTVLSKMTPAAPQTQTVTEPVRRVSDEELRALKSKVPPQNIAILKTMSDTDIIEQVRMYSPDFYARCDAVSLARIPAIVKE